MPKKDIKMLFAQTTFKLGYFNEIFIKQEEKSLSLRSVSDLNDNIPIIIMNKKYHKVEMGNNATASDDTELTNNIANDLTALLNNREPIAIQSICKIANNEE